MQVPHKISYILCFLLIFTFTTEAQAHRIRVFAYENGGIIHVEAMFNGGKAVKDSQVLIQNSDTHSSLLTGVTNREGKFSFPIPDEAKENKYSMDIIVDVGEGHKNHWLLKPEDYLGEAVVQAPQPPKQPQTESANITDSAPTSVLVSEEQLKKLVDASLDEKLAPIKRMLTKADNKGPDLQDILGGIGYILGLAGIAAYFNSRKNQA